MLQLLSRPSASNRFCSPSVYSLFDFDPDGFAIQSVYKHGSIALSAENSMLIAPTMCRIGLSRQHICDSNGVNHEQGLLSLTLRDRRKARKMLEQAFPTDEGTEHDMRLELQVMLMLNIKAELQVLDTNPSGLGDVLLEGLSVTS